MGSDMEQKKITGKLFGEWQYIRGTVRRSEHMRRGTKHSKTFEDRLAEQAQTDRQRAQMMPPGPERDALMRKARQCETAAHLTEWISSPGLQPPK
jgi:hypothetical protein